VICKSVVPMWNENLLWFEAPKHFEHTLFSLLGMLTQALILDTQKCVRRGPKSELPSGLDRLKLPHMDERRCIHEPRVGGAPIRHDHDVNIRACHGFESDRSATTEDFVVRMWRKYDRRCIAAEILGVFGGAPASTRKQYFGKSFPERPERGRSNDVFRRLKGLLDGWHRRLLAR